MYRNLNNKTKLIINYGLLTLAGALFPLGFAPLNFWPLTLLSISLAWLGVNYLIGSPAIKGWFYGIGLFGTGVSWISASMAVSDTPIVIMFVLTFIFCAVMALYFAVQFSVFQKLKQENIWINAISFTALWVVFEWIRGWLFTGFPWLFAGYISTENWLSGFLPIVGVYGLTLLVVSISVLLVFAMNKPEVKKSLGALIIIALIFGSGFLLQTREWSQPAGDPIDTAVVQGNIDQKTKWNVGNIKPTFDLYVSLSQPHLDADLIIWPEAAITELRSKATDLTDLLEYIAVQTNTGIITGILTDVTGIERKHYFNSAIGIGQASGEYHKQRMVPFGEYVPFSSILRPLLGFFNLPMSILEAGDTPNSPLMYLGHSLGTLICYEIAYPAMARDSAQKNSVLLTLSNDAWFGLSFGPYQHLQIARTRAMETGRPVIRATQDGVSAIIDPKGHIQVKADKLKRATIRQMVQPTSGNTPYLIAGHLWIILLASTFLMYAYLKKTNIFERLLVLKD